MPEEWAFLEERTVSTEQQFDSAIDPRLNRLLLE